MPNRFTEQPLTAGDNTTTSKGGITMRVLPKAERAPSMVAWLRDELKDLLTRADFYLALFWVVVMGFFVRKAMSTHMRPIPGQWIAVDGENIFVKDAELDHAFVAWGDQICTTFGCLFPLCALVPLACAFGVGAWCRVRGDLRAFVLGWFWSWGGCNLATNAMKTYVGRLRPYFYGECGLEADPGTQALSCGNPEGERMDARHSFPSGHASNSWVCLFYCALYLCGKLRVAAPWVVGLRDNGHMNPHLANLLRVDLAPLKLVVGLWPAYVAAWVACSRLVDNDHHVGDVLGGTVLGVAFAWLYYSQYFGSIFADGPEAAQLPRAVAAALAARAAGGGGGGGGLGGDGGGDVDDSPDLNDRQVARMLSDSPVAFPPEIDGGSSLNAAGAEQMATI